MATVNMGGADKYGQRYGIYVTGPMMSGFGVYNGDDGHDVGGSYSAPIPNVANVGSNEFLSPTLYLHRRLTIDTAGGDTWRGGMAESMEFSAHGVKEAEALIMPYGLKAPNSAGLLGGCPGSCVKQTLWAGVDLLKQQANGDIRTALTSTGSSDFMIKKIESAKGGTYASLVFSFVFVGFNQFVEACGRPTFLHWKDHQSHRGDGSRWRL